MLLVSAAVLSMLFARAEGRGFQLPGGDGVIVMIAGGWTALLIFYRLLDKPGLQGNERVTATVGVEWGIFIALLLALGLVYAGARMRALERPAAAAAPAQEGAHARPRTRAGRRGHGCPTTSGRPCSSGHPWSAATRGAAFLRRHRCHGHRPGRAGTRRSTPAAHGSADRHASGVSGLHTRPPHRSSCPSRTLRAARSSGLAS